MSPTSARSCAVQCRPPRPVRRRIGLLPDRFLEESWIGCCLLQQKKYEEARKLLLSSYSELKSRDPITPSGQNPNLANIARWAARLYHEIGAGREDRDFDPLRAEPAFQSTLLDLGFPADPFAPVEAGVDGGIPAKHRTESHPDH
jgi:hypothetical protein